MVVGAELIPDFAVQAEVIEGVNVGARMRIHGDRIPRVGHAFIDLARHLERIGGDGPAGRVRHPEMIGGVPEGTTTARHPRVQVDAEIVDLATHDLLQNGESGGVGHHIQGADFIGGAPGTLCRYILGDLRPHAPQAQQ